MIADEVTDEVTEQISICVRFVGKDSNGELCLKESFVCFAEATFFFVVQLLENILPKIS